MEHLDGQIGRIVFGYGDEIILNHDLAPFCFSENRHAAGKVIEKIYLASPEVRERFNSYIDAYYKKASGHDEFLMTVTPDVICMAAIHALT